MPLHVEAWAATDVGRVRAHNEDQYVMEKEIGLFAVADGMGGHQRGEVASALACDVLRERLLAGRAKIDAFRESPTVQSAAEVEALLQEAFISACEEIYQASNALAGDGRMGTTLDAVLLVGSHAFTAHVGDGRIYVVRGGEAHQVSEDHSLVQEQIRAGILTPEEARRSRHRNVITRALGAFPSVLVDMLQLELGPGDRMLICSDGLHGYMHPEELGMYLGSDVDAETPDALISLALRRGGRDNITGLIVSLNDPEIPQPSHLSSPALDVESLRRCDLFAACTYRELVTVAGVTEVRDYPAGAVIFQQEDRGQECFIIESGQIEILRDRIPLASLGPADLFGELSFLDNPRRSASAIALTRTRLLTIKRRDFLHLLRVEKALANKLLWRLLLRLSHVVRSTNDRMLEQIASVPMENLYFEDLDDE